LSPLTENNPRATQVLPFYPKKKNDKKIKIKKLKKNYGVSNFSHPHMATWGDQNGGGSTTTHIFIIFSFFFYIFFFKENGDILDISSTKNPRMTYMCHFPLKRMEIVNGRATLQKLETSWEYIVNF
jgi:hypothetical protein